MNQLQTLSFLDAHVSFHLLHFKPGLLTQTVEVHRSFYDE